jgi:hypothetical protein
MQSQISNVECAPLSVWEIFQDFKPLSRLRPEHIGGSTAGWRSCLSSHPHAESKSFTSLGHAGSFSCPIYIMSTSSYHSVAICGRFAHWEYWDIELQQSSDWDFSNEIHVPICFVIAAATNMFEQDSKGLSTVWKALNSSAGTCRLCLLAFYYCPQWTLGAKATRTLAAERVIVHIFGAEPRLMPKKQNDLWCLPTCCSWDSRVSWHYLFPSRRESALYVLYQRRQQWYCTKGLWLKTSPCHNLPKFI